MRDAIRQIQIVDGVISKKVKLAKKIVVEKPFGFDSETARRYNNILLKAFSD